jgi:hypothetical protein
MGPARLKIHSNSPALPCERCGFDSLHVAKLLDDNGDTFGRTMVCTSCQARRRLPEGTDGLRRTA